MVQRMTRQQLFAVFFFAVFLFLLHQFYHVCSFFLRPLSWAALLALLFYPIHRRLAHALRQQEALSALVLTVSIVLIVIVPGILLTALVAGESAALVRQMTRFIQSGEIFSLFARLQKSTPALLWRHAASLLEEWHLDVPALLLGATRIISGFLVSRAPAAAANLLRVLVDFLLTIFALFFFFRDGARMAAALRDLLPMEPEHKDAVLGQLYNTLSAVVQGTLATAIVQGFLAGLGMWARGVPLEVMLGCATALFSLLPAGGPIAWLPAVAYLLIQARYLHAVLLFLWGAAVVSSADNVLRPVIIGGRTEIPTVFLFFGILGGLQAYGFLGVFLGPILIALLVAFIRIFREQYGLRGEPTRSAPK